jgi:hypothetical protein
MEKTICLSAAGLAGVLLVSQISTHASEDMASNSK